MRKYWKAILIVGALLALMAWAVSCEIVRQASMTAQASGIITKVVLDEDDESSSLDETDLDYSFTVGGAAQGGSDSRPGDVRDRFKTGQRVKVCYNPADPRVSRVEDDQDPCG